MSRRGPRSVAWRLALTIAGAYALATALLGSLVFWATHAIVARQLDVAIQESATALAAEYRIEGTAGLATVIRARESRSADPFGYAVFDPRGRRVAGDMVTTRPPVGWSPIVVEDPQEGPDPARAYALDLAPDRRLVVAADAEPLEHIDEAILVLFAAALLIVLTLGALGVLFVGTFLRRRLGPIVDTADAIAAGSLDRRVPRLGTGDEFDRVAGSLNLMLERFTALVANLRQVSGDLAHDLRTPLTRMRAEFEVVLAAPATLPVYRQTLGNAIEQVDDVLGIFEATLRIAEIEEGAARSRFARLDLGELVREVVEALAPTAEDTRHPLTLTTAPGQWVEGDRQLLAQALINLVGNALDHTPPGTPVSVRVEPPAPPGTASDPGPRVVVADRGLGVPATDRRRVLGRFVRLESSRHTPGHGLGLSIVKAVCDLHGVRLELGDNVPGLRCQLLFPAAP